MRGTHGGLNILVEPGDTALTVAGALSARADLLAFTSTVIALRHAHPVFRRRRFFAGKPIRWGDQALDIAWLTPSGEEMTAEHWDSGFGKSLAVFLNGDGIADTGLLQPGDQGLGVVVLRSGLHRLGYGLTPGGDYDAETEMAVRAFQRHWRPIRVDGVADGDTRARLVGLLQLSQVETVTGVL